MSSDRSRQAPWPFDCIIGGTGMMLSRGPNRESPWSESKVRYFDPQSVMTAEDRTYAQFPPEIDLPKVQDSFAGGYGASHQDKDSSSRYSYTLFADCSSGHPTNGPAMNNQQTLVGTPSDAVTFTVAGVERLFIAVGTKLYRRDDDTGSGLVLRNDFGQTIGQMAVFRGTQSGSFLFIPLGDGANYYTLDSSNNLVQHSSQKASGFVVAGDELFLYVLSSNQWILRKTVNGGSTAIWTGIYPVGDGSQTVNHAAIVNGTLILGKSDGLYAASALVSPLAEDVTPGLHPFNNSNNCKNSTVFDENYIFIYDDGLMRYDPDDGTLIQFGPETIDDNQSEVKGKVVAVTSQDGLSIHALLYNSQTSKTYYVKWGTWELDPKSARRVIIPSWHGSLYQWSKQAVFMKTINMDWGTGAGRIPRIYVGFSDGSIEWFYASRKANPVDDPNYRFNIVNTGEIYLSRFNALFPFEYKVLKHVGIVGHNISGTKQVGASYKIPSDSTYINLGTITNEPGDKLNPSGTPADKAFDLKLTLTTASSTSAPTIDTVVIFTAIRFENLKEIVAWINVSDDILKRDGVPARQRWEDIRNRIETVANSVGSVSVISPSGEEFSCLALEFGHAMLVEDTEKGIYKWVSRIRLVQTRVQATRGTWDRAGAYTWDDLAAFTWNEVTVI